MAKSSRRRLTKATVARCLAVAHRRIASKDYAGAIEPLMEASRHAPRDVAILNDIGGAYLQSQRVAEAILWLLRAIEIQPNVGAIYLNLGQALRLAPESEAAAIQAFQRAVTLSPELTLAHAYLGDLLWERGSPREALGAYEQAYRSSPISVPGRQCRALVLFGRDRHKEAEEEVRRLIVADGCNSRNHLLLGKVLRETGRFEEAVLSFERAIALDPSHASAYHCIVDSKKIGDRDRPLLGRILSLLAADAEHLQIPGSINRQRMTLHFAAGKAFDDLGDYASAIQHFDAANETRALTCAFDQNAVALHVERLIERFTSEFVAKHSDVGSDDPTPILIIGMPRSGTTLVERIVASHPRVRGRGELEFWSQRGPQWDVECGTADPLRKDYLELLLEDSPDALRATDKMPFNFFWVGLVHILFPRAHFLHVRRDPIDTCLSIYTTPVSGIWGFSSRRGSLVSYYRLYLRLMDHWRKVIPPERLLDVDYERTVAEPEETARRLIAFCGLDWDSACLRPEDNRDAIRTASGWQARQPVYRTSVERWRRYEPWIGELRELLATP